MMVEALVGLPAVDLVIVGEGPERAAIEALARERRVADRVRLLGHVRQDRLPDIYSAADLLLLVSTHEGWPNVLLESMACGTPVIASDIDAIADIVAAPEAGRILKEPTPERLAATAREFLGALPARAATRAYAEGFDWQSTTEGQITLFREICKHTTRSARCWACRLVPEHPSIHLGVTGNTVRPRAFGIDELDRAGPYTWPGRPIGERCRYPFHEALRLVRGK